MVVRPRCHSPGRALEDTQAPEGREIDAASNHPSSIPFASSQALLLYSSRRHGYSQAACIPLALIEIPFTRSLKQLRPSRTARR
jgi:hypothetical protein